MSARVVMLARHATHDEVGRVLSGRSAIALNAAGQAEAKALAEGLAGTAIASIHASPRVRATQTAAAVAAMSGLPIRIARALDEIDFGAFTGRSFAALEQDAAWRSWNADRHGARCPAGETMVEAVSRAGAYLRALAPEQCPALCVTHCDVIRGLIVQARGDRYDAVFGIDCDPASVTTVEIDADGMMRVLSLNRLPR